MVRSEDPGTDTGKWASFNITAGGAVNAWCAVFPATRRRVRDAVQLEELRRADRLAYGKLPYIGSRLGGCYVTDFEGASAIEAAGDPRYS
jgi:hypothetical protein